MVGLHGDVGEPLPLHWFEDYQAALHFAEEVAVFLHFPCTDASGTQTIVRVQGASQKLLSSVEPTETSDSLAPQPTAARCRLSWHGATLVIVEPRVGWKKLIGYPLLVFLMLTLPCLGFGTFAHFFEAEHPVNVDPLVGSALFVGLLLVLLCVFVLGSMPQLCRRQVVEADGAGLRFRSEGLFSTKDKSIRGADISHLRIAFGHLTAVTPRDCWVVCGSVDSPLSKAELEWLRGQLTRALRGETMERSAESGD
jgi:hypothetical protein